MVLYAFVTDLTGAVFGLPEGQRSGGSCFRPRFLEALVKKLALNLAAFTVVAAGGLYLASPAAAVATGDSERESTVTCSDGTVTITISNGGCEMIDNRCHCWQE
jgi:hypothetical protein